MEAGNFVVGNIAVEQTSPVLGGGNIVQQHGIDDVVEQQQLSPLHDELGLSARVHTVQHAVEHETLNSFGFSTGPVSSNSITGGMTGLVNATPGLNFNHAISFAKEKLDRKETMKMYMREYRLRVKKQLYSMPDREKTRLLDQQRQRVRMRVRRHRMRKKLRSKGLDAFEIERRLADVVPMRSQQSRSTTSPLSVSHSMSPRYSPLTQQDMMSDSQPNVDNVVNADKPLTSICLDMPKSTTSDNAYTSSSFHLRQAQSLMDGTDLNTGFTLDDNTILNNFHSHIDTAKHHCVDVSKLAFERDTESYTASQISANPTNQSGEETKVSNVSSTAQAVKLSPCRWSVTQVGIFLEGLELSALKTAFGEHAVDGQALLDLTPLSLQSMGVAPQDVQRELLSAIASLKKVACVM